MNSKKSIFETINIINPDSLVALGSHSHPKSSIAIGRHSQAGKDSLAIGRCSFAPVENAMAIGSYAHASVSNSIALGFMAVSTKENELALQLEGFEKTLHLELSKETIKELQAAIKKEITRIFSFELPN